MEKGRWRPEPNEIVARLDLATWPKFFDSTLIIDSGTWALLVEAGQVPLELQSGVYSPATLLERSRQGRPATISVLLAEKQDYQFRMECENFLTRDDLLATASLELAVAIKDMNAVYSRLLGSRKSLTCDNLKQLLLPLIKQLMLEAMATYSLAELQAPSARALMEDVLLPKLNSNINRYGLATLSLRSWSVTQYDVDSTRQSLARTRAVAHENLANQSAEIEIASDKLKLELQRREQSNQLTSRAHQIANERLASDVSIKMQRMQIRAELRQALVDAQIDSWTAKNKLANFRRTRDRENLLSDIEYQKYAAELNNERQQQASRHANVMKQLELQQDADLAALRLELDYSHQREAHRAQLELTRFVDQNADVDWQSQLQREMSRAELLHQKRLQEIVTMREQALAQDAASHDVDSRALKQQLTVEQLRGELRLTQEQIANRVRLSESETNAAIKDLESEAEIRHQQRARELHAHTLGQQLEVLTRLNALNQTYWESQPAVSTTMPVETGSSKGPIAANESFDAKLAELNLRAERERVASEDA